MLDPNRLRSMTLPQILKARAQAHGDTLALREKDRGLWRRTTWKGYYETTRLFAIGLYSLGLRTGDRLAIASDDTPEWFYSDLAAQMLGGAGLGIYPTNPWPELQYIVRHSRAKIVVCGDQEQTDKVLDAQAKEGGLPDLVTIVCVDMKGMRHYRQNNLMSFDAVLDLGRKHEAKIGPLVDAALAAGKPDDVAIIVYTSGTTGNPKGAQLSHGNMLHASMETVAIYGLDAQTYSVLCYLPLCHVAERAFSAVMQLVTGCTVSFAESVDTVVMNLREIAPRGFLGVPRIWEKMQQSVFYRVKDTTPFQRHRLFRSVAVLLDPGCAALPDLRHDRKLGRLQCAATGRDHARLLRLEDRRHRTKARA
jgi:long-chain acyl-CoA synthetase